MSGAANCINLVKAKTEPVTIMAETTNLFGGRPADKNHETEQTWSFSLDVETSDNEMLAGESSDMFLVPALNVIFLDTDVISFDTETCEVSKSRTTTWSLDSDENTEVMSWLSAFEIETKELPDLKRRLDNAEANGDSDEEIAELERAIDAWQANLDRNKEVRDMAATGGLSSVHDFWTASEDTFDHDNVDPIDGEMNKGIALAPHGAIDGAVDTDGGAADDTEKNDLRAINTIKFSGGGSTYSFTYEESTEKSVVSTSETQHEVKAGAAFSFELASSGVGAAFKITPLGIGEFETSEGEEEGYSTSYSASFTLGDPDPLDVFDVQIFKHPDFNTLVFHTTSGQSSCPHEDGTLPLELPSMNILRQPAAPVLPNEPAVFELLLKNDGERYSDFNLFMLNSENQDGLTVRVDGRPLSAPVDYEGFPVGARRVTVLLERGPSKYDYDPVAIGWCVLLLLNRERGRGKGGGGEK